MGEESWSLSTLRRTGTVVRGLKSSELITYIQEHIEYNGDTEVFFMMEGCSNDIMVQFDHFKDALVINVEEEEDN